MRQIELRPEWVKIDLDVQSDVEAITYLSSLLYEEGVVARSYIDAVIERERDMSTGLSCDGIGVAIPHADANHVIKQAMGIGILKKPVVFRQMGTPELPVNVKIVMLLAIKEPKEHLAFLQTLMKLFEQSEVLHDVARCKTANQVIHIYDKFFNLKESI